MPLAQSPCTTNVQIKCRDLSYTAVSKPLQPGDSKAWFADPQDYGDLQPICFGAG